MDMRFKGFSHTDLDGVVSSIIATKYYMLKGYSVTTEHCNYDNINNKIIEYLNSYEYNPNTIIFITDISCSYDVALKLDNLSNKVILIDHHQTALEDLSKKEEGKTDFKWSYIKEGDSASLLTYKYFLKLCELNNDIDTYNKIKEYEKLVYLTDLWDTKSRLSDEYIKNRDKINRLNTLFNALGISSFKARFLLNPSIEFTIEEDIKVDTLLKIKDNVCKYTKVYVLPYNKNGYKFLYGLAFSNLYKSDIAEYHFNLNKDLAIMFILDFNSCSCSLRRNGLHPLCEEIDLSKIAEQFDGGGHPFAAGFSFEIKDYDKVMKRIIKADFECGYI